MSREYIRDLISSPLLINPTMAGAHFSAGSTEIDASGDDTNY